MNIEFLKGSQSDQQYKDIEYFNKGGMGEIYLAIDNITNNQVAIKIIPVDSIDEAKLLKTETEIALSLNHSNIVETFFTSEFKLKGKNYFYSVMEYLPDGSLRELLKNQSKIFDLPTALNFMFDIANGLDYAHKTFIHRDLKPENILVSDKGLKICDFGLSKYIDSKTRTNSFKGSGTLPYMSPECWTFDANTIAMDIYSLGIIFFEILTLQLPFTAINENEFKNKHLFELFPSINKLRNDIPIRLNEMISKMTNKRTNDRYRNVSEVLTVMTEIQSSIHSNQQIKNNDVLLQKVQQKISESQRQELENQKKMSLDEMNQKFISYSINDLFQKFLIRVNELNNELEREKITYKQDDRALSIMFQNRKILFSFFSQTIIGQIIKDNKEAFYQFQEKKYHMIVNEYKQTNIEKENIILVGKAYVTSDKSNKEAWGFNFLLRKKSPDDLYGDWLVAWFNDSPLINKYPLSQHYTLDLPLFLKYYEYGRERVTSEKDMGYNILHPKVIEELLEKLID